MLITDFTTDYRIISHSYVTLLIHKGENITTEQAEQAVRHALDVCGYEPWESMSIEIFAGDEVSLLIASPCKVPEVHIAEYELPFINEYFTE